MAQVIAIDRGSRAVRSTASVGTRCQAMTAAGRRCRNRAAQNGFCGRHAPPMPAPRIGPLRAELISDALAFLARRATGQYRVDEFGFDVEMTETVLMPLLGLLINRYWRVDWVGLSNVPESGPALLVGNHAGTLPVDALVMKFGVLGNHPAHRHIRLLAADLAFRLPVVSPMARKMGNTLACDEDAQRLLAAGELVGVFPEGFKGVGKLYRDRYRLQRFGRGGFVKIAIAAGVPIVPVAIVGSEEIYPMIGRSKRLARLLGLPYFPITPLFPWLGPLGMIPLPSKWIVEFGKPIPTDDLPEDAGTDRMLQFELADEIQDTLQQMLHANLTKRRSAFF